ncbi:OmpA family protein [Telluribacter sp.]|jgi:OOP family OmpA-OmpF porin|uniref:OmpA family protein n=1 Tax=Telluribacter sp. TaxID=1978767 RepID=UPI002E0EBE1E|nr:OmpA family protein [Telluribacter sp.]
MKKISLLISSLALGSLMALPLSAQPLSSQQPPLTQPTQPNSPDYNPNAAYEGPYKLNTWSISIHGGPTQFFGDLREYDFKPVTENSSDSYSEWGTFQGGITLNKQLTYLFGLRADVTAGALRGMKRRLYSRYFRSSYTDFAVAATVNLKGLFFGGTKMKHWKIDGYVGAGQVWYNSTAYELGTGQTLRSTNGATNDWIIPLGMTFNYELSRRLDLGIDFRVNHVNSDIVDATFGGDFSRDPNDGTNINGFTTNRRGNSALDKYGYGAVMLTYKLGKNPLRVTKTDGKYEYTPEEGFYHLRYTDPKLLVKPPKILTLEEMDSVAKANRPPDIDPRLLLDTDGDGVSDFFDKEPNSPAGSVVDGSGRVIDFDRYVKDAIASGATCSEIFTNVMFDTDKSIIKPEYREMLTNVATLMNRSGCRLQLAGHADRRASDRYNMALSRRRVDAVRDFLVNEGGLQDASKIIVDYFGSFKPIADGTSRTGLQRNRRVELKLLP